jgi:hypothetical protein
VNEALATLFVNPIMLSRLVGLLMLLPLCLAISIVYKTIKTDDLRAVPMAAAASWGAIVAGMLAVGVTIYILYNLTA